MTTTRPSRLVRRLRMLRNLEWFNIPFLILAASTTWSQLSLSWLWQRLLAYSLVAAFLATGGWYWHLKAQEIVHREPIGHRLTALATVQRVAPAVLGVATGALAVSWITGTGHTADRGWATAFVALAWLEYVNYFRVQLMHDTRADLRRLLRTGHLRQASLAADLEKLGSPR